ncbi:hypothetical protein BOTBODRAFT_575781 [Botryobasidium botryosum FD-172 SS1]|uniref:HMG box domain-containing protein n=1 Tax=Botryobasidium botryosum (strain FD-172 SS1) TaxID=930990 RepID=A0A067N019_BOTB1|nr:hypothetical protein BOTBODRAFT_575781 [Botryobasidium botryosum FD-172 SS1]
MRTGEISKILSREWQNMDKKGKQYYLNQAKKLKDNFNARWPDYVYKRRPNNSRKRRRSSGALGVLGVRGKDMDGLGGHNPGIDAFVGQYDDHHRFPHGDHYDARALDHGHMPLPGRNSADGGFHLGLGATPTSIGGAGAGHQHAYYQHAAPQRLPQHRTPPALDNIASARPLGPHAPSPPLAYDPFNFSSSQNRWSHTSSFANRGSTIGTASSATTSSSASPLTVSLESNSGFPGNGSSHYSRPPAIYSGDSVGGSGVELGIGENHHPDGPGHGASYWGLTSKSEQTSATRGTLSQDPHAWPSMLTSLSSGAPNSGSNLHRDSLSSLQSSQALSDRPIISPGSDYNSGASSSPEQDAQQSSTASNAILSKSWTSGTPSPTELPAQLNSRVTSPHSSSGSPSYPFQTLSAPFYPQSSSGVLGSASTTPGEQRTEASQRGSASNQGTRSSNGTPFLPSFSASQLGRTSPRLGVQSYETSSYERQYDPSSLPGTHSTTPPHHSPSYTAASPRSLPYIPRQSHYLPLGAGGAGLTEPRSHFQLTPVGTGNASHYSPSKPAPVSTALHGGGFWDTVKSDP